MKFLSIIALFLYTMPLLYSDESVSGLEEEYNFKITESLDALYSEDRFVSNVEIVKKKSDVDLSDRKTFNVAVNIKIDGSWKNLIDDDSGEILTKDNKILREYIEASPGELDKVEELVKLIIDFHEGDEVIVTSEMFDRSEEFVHRDKEFFDQLQNNNNRFIFLIFMLFLIPLALILIIIKLVKRK